MNNDELGELAGQARYTLLRNEMHGSLTFRMCVENRDWEAVKHMAPQQRDAMHGVPSLTAEDWRHLRAEALKDGVEL